MPGHGQVGGLRPLLWPLQRDCHNYIKMLLQLNSTHLYTCGTCAFSPACAYIVSMGSGARVPLGMGALQRGSRALVVLVAHSPVPLQNVQHFSLEQDASGRVLLEDGKGRCPFDPEYRSTAVMVGKAHRPRTLTQPSPSRQHPGCSARLSRGQAGTDPNPGRGAGLCWAARAGSQRECLFGRRRALRWDRQQLPGQRADHLPQPGEPHRSEDGELAQLAAG